MCLDRPAKKFRTKKEKGELVAWKIFNQKTFDYETGPCLFTMFQGFADVKFPVGEWVNEKEWRLSSRGEIYFSSIYSAYPKGFHMYRCKKDAVKSNNTSLYTGVIRKVYYRNPVAYGYGVRNGTQEIVAKEMFIPPKKGE